MKRIEYIDAFRGLCVFIVVYTHIIYFGMPGYDYKSGIHTLFTSFFLIGFFFISGFVAYKVQEWRLYDVSRYVWRKMWAIFVPTLVTGTIFMLSCGNTFFTMAFHNAKMGYWFTWALFVMMVVYAIVMMVVSRINNDWLGLLVLVISAFLCVVLKHCVPTTGRLAVVLELNHFFYYMPYFLLGMICKKHKDVFHKWIVEKPLALWIAIVMVIMGYYIVIPLILRNVSIIVLVYVVVKKIYEDLTECQNAPSSPIINCHSNLGRNNHFPYLPHHFLSYIGRYTIEIYFLHYFLLFNMPSQVVNYMIMLSEGGRGVGFVEFILVSCVSVIIIFVSIIISAVLKKLPYVGILMFGRS